MATTSGPNPLLQLTPSQVIRAESAQWRQAIRQALADTRCATPAFLVEDLDPITQTVTVQIAIQERVRTTKGAKWWDTPPIVKVPIVVPRGGGYSITLPLKKGDEGLLVFCDTCFDLWWKHGQSGTVAQNKPNSGGKTQKQNEVRRHYIHDCGFVPGMWSQPNKLATYAADSLQIRSDDRQTIIDVSITGVTVTAPAFRLETTGDVEFNIGGDFIVTAGGAISITSAVDVSISPLNGGGF